MRSLEGLGGIHLGKCTLMSCLMLVKRAQRMHPLSSTHTQTMNMFGTMDPVASWKSGNDLELHTIVLTNLLVTLLTSKDANLK